MTSLSQRYMGHIPDNKPMLKRQHAEATSTARRSHSKSMPKLLRQHTEATATTCRRYSDNKPKPKRQNADAIARRSYSTLKLQRQHFEATATALWSYSDSTLKPQRHYATLWMPIGADLFAPNVDLSGGPLLLDVKCVPWRQRLQLTPLLPRLIVNWPHFLQLIANCPTMPDSCLFQCIQTSRR